MNSCFALAEDNIAYLLQGIALLEGMSDEVYVRGNPVARSSGCGPHLRHCLDHYESFLKGLATGTVDYDERTRDSRTETNRTFAIDKIRRIISGLGSIPATRAENVLAVRMDCGPAQECTRSSVSRELQFLVSHTVHHYALIAFVLRTNGIEPGAEFGVAPSTLRHQKSTASCAP